jgi:hypothetical protein
MKTAGLFTLAASQVDKSLFGGDGGYQYSQVRMILANVLDEDKEVSSDNLRYIQGVNTICDRDTYIEERLLRNNTYVLFIQIEWKEKCEKYHNK